MCYFLQSSYKLDSVSYNQSIFLHFCGTEILNKSNFVYKNSVMTVAYKEFLVWLKSLLPVSAAHHKGKTKTLALHLEG